MTTKEGCLISRGNSLSGGQYSNLNLNQNHKCLSPAAFGTSKSISFNNRKNNNDITHSSHSKIKNNSWNNSVGSFSSSSSIGINPYGYRKEKDKKQSKKDSNINNSTLSLHIAAYENSNENSLKEKQSKFNKTWKEVKQLFIQSSQVHNPFEFPRQQKNKHVDPELMQFKASQKLLNPNVLNFNILDLLQSNSREMGLRRDELLDSLVDTIYMITAQPLIQLKLHNFFTFCGQPYNLEETCRSLGYRSFNQSIRENKKIFSKFLEIYVALKIDENNKNSMVLYYQNRDVKDQGILLDNLKDRVIEDAHAQISIDDTIYFEIHNDPQYIQGRKNLASAVNKCQEIADDSFEWVDMEHLQRAFPLIFDGEDYSKHRLKEWFPAQGGKMDQILQNIVFEEIEYKYSNPEQKVGLLFRLKEGETIQSITEKLNNFEKQVKPWRENLEQKILNDFDSRRRYKRNSRDENYGGGGGNGNPNSYRPQQQKPTTSNNLRTTGPKMQKAPVSKIFGDSDSDDDARVENARYKANSYVRQKKSPIENTAVTKDTVVVGDASKPGLPKFEEKRFEDYQFIIKKYRLSKDSNLNELFLESMKEQAEKNVQEPGSSKVTVSKVEIPAKKVAERVSLSPVLGNQFLNQARRPSYNADKAYTDDDEDEENDGDDDDDSSIVSKPSLNAVVKKNPKIGNSSSSDSENQSAAADTAAATNDLLNTPKETNNKSSSSSEEEENLNKMSEDRSKKPLVSSAGGSNPRTPAAAPPFVHQPPKRFEFLTGRFNPSTEIPKSKKEQHRLEREKANGTNVKKEKQMTHQLPKPVANPVSTTTTSPPGATTTPGRAQAESTTTNGTVATATATRTTRRTPDPNPSAAGTSQFHNSGQLPENTNVQRDQVRPYNYGAQGNNVIPVNRRPGEQPRRNRVASPPLAPPSPPPPPAAKPVGGFAIPYNIPKTLNTAVTTTATTSTTTATVTAAAAGERRQNPDMNRREQGHAQEGILRPIPQRPPGGASPLAPQHSNTGGAANDIHSHVPPVAPHNNEPRRYRERDEHILRPEASSQVMHRQNSQNSVNSQGERRRRRPPHNYAVRPATAQPGYNDYRNNRNINESEVGFQPLPHSPLPDIVDEDCNEQYHQHHQQQQQQPQESRYHNHRENNYPQDWNNDGEVVRGARTPLPTRDEYIPSPPPQQPQRQYHHEQEMQNYPQQHHQQQQIPRNYPDDSNQYAVPNQRSRQSSRSVASEQQHYHYPQNGSQQGNHYALSDNGYRNPQDGRRDHSSPYQNFQPQQQQRPSSAYPSSAYPANSHPRPLSVHSQQSSEYRNPAIYRQIGDGARSVVQPDWQQKRIDARDNTVNAVIEQIRITMTSHDFAVNLNKIGTVLAKARLPNEPKYIENLGIDNWKDFINEYLSGEFLYFEHPDGQFIVDINKIDGHEQ